MSERVPHARNSLTRSRTTAGPAGSQGDGQVRIFTKDGAKYVLRENAPSYDGWSAVFTPADSSRVTLKIRRRVPG
jgi:hypothetical protein